MKKAYKKPDIAYNELKLSESIAAGCEYISNHTVNQCALEVEGFEETIFTDRFVCQRNVPDGYNAVCYHVPFDSGNVFSS